MQCMPVAMTAGKLYRIGPLILIIMSKFSMQRTALLCKKNKTTQHIWIFCCLHAVFLSPFAGSWPLCLKWGWVEKIREAGIISMHKHKHAYFQLNVFMVRAQVLYSILYLVVPSEKYSLIGHCMKSNFCMLTVNKSRKVNQAFWVYIIVSCRGGDEHKIGV